MRIHTHTHNRSILILHNCNINVYNINVWFSTCMFFVLYWMFFLSFWYHTGYFFLNIILLIEGLCRPLNIYNPTYICTFLFFYQLFSMYILFTTKGEHSFIYLIRMFNILHRNNALRLIVTVIQLWKKASKGRMFL